MAKEDKKAPEPEQAPEVTAPVEQTPAEVQAELDRLAGFAAMIEAAGPALDKIADGWKQVLQGIAECDRIQQDQKAAVALAKEHSLKHGTPSQAIEFGHGPLVAHSHERVAKLPLPVVDLPQGYVRHFRTRDEQMTEAQVLFNNGTTLLAPHATKEEVHQALLSGVRPSDIQSQRTPVQELNAKAKSWFGFRVR
jgi:hypothetical protein